MMLQAQYSENAIACDFDKLSLVTEGIPKEKITDYNVTLSPRKQCDYSLLSLSERTVNVAKPAERFENDRWEPLPTYGDKGVLSKNHQVALSIMGKGRGKIIVPKRDMIDQCELDLEREKGMRLTNPLGYSNELIEYHNAVTHGQKENVPQAVAAPPETCVPISSNNVALSSLSKNAKKQGKKPSNSNTQGFVLNNENFPKLK